MEASEYQDPDYPAVAIADAGPTHAEVHARLERARSVLNREFQAEIEARETELATIDDRMWQTRRSLHRLRCYLLQQHYAMSTSHHNEPRQHQSRPQVSAILRNKQSRLHPTQRRLTSKNIVSNEELFLTHQPQDSAQANNYTSAEDADVLSLRSEDSLSKKTVKCEASVTKPEETRLKMPKKIPRHIEPERTGTVVTLDQSTRSRQKHKYRIIIGNTSKYSPGASAADRCTHAWLLYVRAPWGSGDRSAASGDASASILRRVVVNLHESYAPHRVCDLHSPPFQVSRRGWGEFPARVELHFALPELNPPAAVEHVVRLDKRCTGLQSLGAETIVEVWLYSNQDMLKYAIKDDTNNEKEKISESHTDEDQWSDFFSTESTELDIDEMIIKPVKKTNFETGRDVQENLKIKEELIDDEIAEEIDIHIGQIKQEPEESLFENGKDTESEGTVCENEKNNDTVAETNIIKCVDPQTNKTYYVQLDKRFHFNSITDMVLSEPGAYHGKYCHIQKDHCYVPKEDFPRFKEPCKTAVSPDVKNGKKHRFDLGEAVSKMNCVRSAVNFLLGKIPLISSSAEAYRSMFPFVVPDEDTYWQMSEVRRRNAEWSRAKIINKILTKHFPVKPAIWRTKQILYFSRLHGYQPIPPSNVQTESELWTDHESQWRLHQNLKKCFPSPADINSGGIFDEERFKNVKNDDNAYSEPIVLPCDSDDELDVIGVAADEVNDESVSPVKKKLEVLPIEDDEEKMRCIFIEKTCSDIGIELKNEDVGSGFSHSAVHRVISSAVRSLVSELLRSSLAETRLQEGTPPLWSIPGDGEIGIQHIFTALRRDDRLNLFTMESLYATPTQYNERL